MAFVEPYKPRAKIAEAENVAHIEIRFFKEFAVRLLTDPQTVNKALISKGFLGGLALKRYYPELRNGWLLAVAEKRTKAEMDAFVQAVKECMGAGM